MTKTSSDDELALDAAEMAGDKVPTLDLHGKRTFEAESLLDQFVNDEFMKGSQFVKIIHGFGTGILQKTVKDYLTRHPLVKLHRTIQLSGATVVVLEEKG